MSKPKEIIAEYPYAVAYKQGQGFYAEGLLNGKPQGKEKARNAEWARHAAQQQSDSLARIVKRRG